MARPRWGPNMPERVRVKDWRPKGFHLRTPWYLRGKTGVIERSCGAFPNPEELAYGFDGLPKKTLYRVRFNQKEVWPNYAGPAIDTVDVDIYEHWLKPA